MNRQCSADIIIYPYQTQAVRDLAWACFSPSLLHLGQVPSNRSGVAANSQHLTPARQRWLEELDRDTRTLQQHLSRRTSHRLGIYFEQLWHFFLQHDPEVQLIAHNLPIHCEGRTLGEFDCIYYCRRRQRHVHLELAVKYFLGTHRSSAADPAGNAREWLGPDKRDRLDLKLDQLFQRQIMLGENPASQSTLLSLGVDSLIKEVALKGYLFQPLTNAPPPPPGYNYARPLYHWVPHEQLSHYCASLNSSTFLLLPKMQWLSSTHSDGTIAVWNAVQLEDHLTDYFERETYPLLIAAINEDGIESSRFFVTADNWGVQHP